eukprot:3149237-Prymnesium_polylepis.1
MIIIEESSTSAVAYALRLRCGGLRGLKAGFQYAMNTRIGAPAGGSSYPRLCDFPFGSSFVYTLDRQAERCFGLQGPVKPLTRYS